MKKYILLFFLMTSLFAGNENEKNALESWQQKDNLDSYWFEELDGKRYEFQHYFLLIPVEVVKQHIIKHLSQRPDIVASWENSDEWLESRLQRSECGNIKTGKYILHRTDGKLISFYLHPDETTRKLSHIIRRSSVPSLIKDTMIFSNQDSDIGCMMPSPSHSTILFGIVASVFPMPIIVWQSYNRDTRECKIVNSMKWPYGNLIKAVAISDDATQVGLFFVKTNEARLRETEVEEDLYKVGTFNTQTGKKLKEYILCSADPLRKQKYSASKFMFNKNATKIGICYFQCHERVDEQDQMLSIPTTKIISLEE